MYEKSKWLIKGGIDDWFIDSYQWAAVAGGLIFTVFIVGLIIIMVKSKRLVTRHDGHLKLGFRDCVQFIEKIVYLSTVIYAVTYSHLLFLNMVKKFSVALQHDMF